MADTDDFDRIAASNPDLSAIGAHSPDEVMVLIGVEGERARVTRLDFIAHSNWVLNALKDTSSDLASVLAPVAKLEPLARRVILNTAFQHFKDWMLERCPVGQVPLSVFHLPAFVAAYRELVADAPEYSGRWFREDPVGS